MLLPMASELNFTVSFSPSDDRKWGSLINGTWNGLVGMLVRNKSDMVAASLTWTLDRDKYVFP